MKDYIKQIVDILKANNLTGITIDLRTNTVSEQYELNVSLNSGAESLVEDIQNILKSDDYHEDEQKVDTALPECTTKEDSISKPSSDMCNHQNKNGTGFISVWEIAKLLNISLPETYRWLNNDLHIPAKALGRYKRKLYDRTQMMELIDERLSDRSELMRVDKFDITRHDCAVLFRVSDATVYNLRTKYNLAARTICANNRHHTHRTVFNLHDMEKKITKPKYHSLIVAEIARREAL